MIPSISSQEFATTFRLKPERFAWLMGAGASASAGIPTGYSMISDFKKKLFCQRTNLSPRQVDSDDPLWKRRISSELLSILPPPDDPTEYAAAFEAVYPTQEARRLYIQEQISKGSPSFGHKVLGALVSSRCIPCIFTTNFDQLVESSVTVTDQLLPPGDQARMTVAALDSADRAERCMAEQDFPLLSKLHGDFQSIELKNTNEELREQDFRHRRVLTTACSRFGLIVVGYSGRDASVMETLGDVLEKPDSFPGGLFWVTRSEDSLLPAVSAFLERADRAGVTVRIVISKTFDEFAGDLVDYIDLPEVLSDHVRRAARVSVIREVPLPTIECQKFPILQCSALPILNMPTHARQLTINAPATTAEAREQLRRAGLKRSLVASIGCTIAAFGSDEDLLNGLSPFEPRLDGMIELDLRRDSWARGLLYDALVRAVCRSNPLIPCLRRTGHFVMVAERQQANPQIHSSTNILRVAYGTSLAGTVPDTNCKFSEGIEIRLEHAAGRWWCVFNPFTHTDLPRGVLEDSEESAKIINTVADWRRERWAQRYNSQWAKILRAWSQILSGGGKGPILALGVDHGAGIDAKFILSAIPGWSRPGNEHSYLQRT
jgi:hypothetical protein